MVKLIGKVRKGYREVWRCKMIEIEIESIVFRIVAAVIVGSAIGYERQQKNRPAGIRTHILVAVGATLTAILQQEIANQALLTAIQDPTLANIVRSDPARLIAQVVSGIGFLGAGTIVVNKNDVKGLTTAASIWTVACLGLVIGMGYYKLAVVGFIAILFSLTLVERIIHVPKYKNLEIHFVAREDTKNFLNDYFQAHNIRVKDVVFESFDRDDRTEYKNVFTIDIPRKTTYANIVDDLSLYHNITKIRMIALD